MIASDSPRRFPIRSNRPVALLSNVLLAVSAAGASPQSMQLQQELGNLRRYYAFPVSSMRDRRRDRFARLASIWRGETQWLSSTTEIAMHPAYQAIIGMGPEALPMILEDLRENSGHWYWALKAISDEDPVPPQDRGMVRKMRAAWLQWGKERGLSSR